MLAKLKRLNHRHLLPDIFLVVFSFYVSLYLRLGWDDFGPQALVLSRYVFLFVVLRIGTFVAFGIYDIIWRYVSMTDVVKLLKGVLLSTSLIIAATYLVDIGHLPRATFLIDAVLVTVLIAGVRFARRLMHESSRERAVVLTGRRTLVYGAGTNGRALVHRFHADNDIGMRIVGFIDDNPEKVGRVIAGVKVLGTRKELGDVIRDFKVQEIIVGISRPPADVIREVIQACRTARINPRLVSAMSNVTGKNQHDKHIQSFRNIELSDLLTRPSRNIDISAFRDFIHKKRVLLTGAGGSIGSELARQILNCGPSRLVLLDHSEFNLYQIDQELQGGSGEQDPILSRLLDIKDRESLEVVFKENLPELVFHAAAYKHVHLVEANPLPAILNNVEGTLNLLELSREYNVDTFVLISTDKAVNPVGIMGATKRVCELMVAEQGRESGKRYCAVRFGNVLGSSGSLIPLLKKQIDKNQPVTITHKDMTRYFMLISEAVSLVLKAATIAQPGDITLLRMGDPVKIVDVARNLILLMGKSEEEVPLVYTGLRPGEKLFEELYICGNELDTQDPDILIVPRGDFSRANDRTSVFDRARRIIALAQLGDREAVFLLNALVKSSGEFDVPGAKIDADDVDALPEIANREVNLEFPERSPKLYH